MANGVELLKAFQVHYEPNDGGQLRYNDQQKLDIIRTVGDVPGEYLSELYLVVTQTHEAKFRSLPDAAVVSKAMASMDDPATYLPPQKLLDEPSPVVQELVEQVRESENGNEFERQRIRNRVAKNDATVYERWWIHVIDDLGGNWEPMPETRPIVMRTAKTAAASSP